ncbi:MAG: hypothetical protein ACI945_001238, partial [Pseudohongiellaceae bacterium]
MKRLDTKRKFRVLFLQPKEYFLRLGFVLNDDFDEDFGFFSLYQTLHKICDYDAVVTCIDHSHSSRYICRYAGSRGIPSILVMDGIFEWSNAVANPFLKANGIKLLSPCVYSEVMTIDAGLNAYINNSGQNSRMYSIGSQAVTSEECRKKSNFLVSTANKAYFTLEERDSLCLLMKDVVECLKKGSYTYGFRIFDPYIKSYLGIHDDENHVDGTFEVNVDVFDCLITTPSTIAQTAMERSMPVALLDYRDAPIFLNSGWRINGRAPIEITLDSMRGRDDDRMRFQRDQICCESLNSALLDSVGAGYLKADEEIGVDYLLRSRFIF